MLSVSQDWINNYKRSIMAEANIFLDVENLEISQTINLNKNDIKNFSFKETGDILNRKVPYAEITFDVYIGGVVKKYDFPLHSYVRLYYSYWFNNQWEKVFAGRFQIVEKNIPANGLFASYKLNNHKYISLNSEIIYYDIEHSGGSNKNLYSQNMTAKLLAEDVMNRSMTFASLPTTVIGKGLGTMSKIEVLQTIASACGYTLSINDVDTNKLNRPQFLDLTFSTTSINYNLTLNNLSEFPEVITDEKTKNYKIHYYTYSAGDNDYLHFPQFPDEASGGVYSLYVKVKPEDIYAIVSWTGVETIEVAYYRDTVQADRTGISPDTTTVTYSKMNTIDRSEEKSYFSTGEDIEIENKLINGNYYGRAEPYYRLWLGSIVHYSCKGNIDPRLQLFDKLTIQDKNGDIHYCIAEEVSITFDGTYKGSVVAREIGFYPPVIKSMTLTSSTSYSIVIENRNPFDVAVVFDYSSGEYDSVVLSANETKTINYSNASFLSASIEYYLDYDLDSPVDCHFEYEDNFSRTNVTDSVSVLKRNDIVQTPSITYKSIISPYNWKIIFKNNTDYNGYIEIDADDMLIDIDIESGETVEFTPKDDEYYFFRNALILNETGELSNDITACFVRNDDDVASSAITVVEAN